MVIKMSGFDSHRSQYARLIWTYSLMVKLTAHNGRSVVQFHLCPLVMSTDIKQTSGHRDRGNLYQKYALNKQSGFKWRVHTLVGS